MATTIDSRLLEALSLSTCFGLAHDDTVPECKQCDVKAQCKKKSEGADIPTPTSRVVSESRAVEPAVETTKVTSTKTKAKSSTTTSKKAATKPSTATKKSPAKSTTSIPGNAPDFKSMTLDELKGLAKEHSVEWKDYGNDSITRMRLIMALKKAY